jgi:hypothetical protein
VSCTKLTSGATRSVAPTASGTSASDANGEQRKTAWRVAKIACGAHGELRHEERRRAAYRERSYAASGVKLGAAQWRAAPQASSTPRRASQRRAVHKARLTAHTGELHQSIRGSTRRVAPTAIGTAASDADGERHKTARRSAKIACCAHGELRHDERRKSAISKHR